MSETTATNGQGAHLDFANGQQSTAPNEQAYYQNGFHEHGGVLPKPHQATVSQVYAPVSKPANPGPLGLISFALTTFCLGFYQCGVGLPGANSFGNVGPYQVIFGLALFMGGAAQFVAGIMEFTVGNTFGTTVHVSYGAFWLSFALTIYPNSGVVAAYGNDGRALSVHLGIFLIAWFLVTVLFLVAALRTNVAIILVFSFLSLAFLFLACAEFVRATHPTTGLRLNRAGGAFAIIDALCAFYAGFSGVMTEDTTWVKFPLGELDYRTPIKKHRSHEASVKQQ
ncbi:hypothetical protein NLU13_8562 [Sarocladium strictum]|uniref:Uncharacterized protein n=1 Tax=Sarocladium strictum TaxID=5046 RepID=A0AA39GCG4_SARSR|nr:hypothetical protein NLU13_8562 [Sarocladium strictum]